ncbi:MAG: hypothetical protein SFU53_06850 [Terrimicrobiaceae bacterium]|nr:hypothetical protein [Terrimicrobiaceae bacterium]
MLKPNPLWAAALAISLPVSAWAERPAESVDLSKFPAASVDDVVVPVPSEIFLVLDKLGSPNWRGELRSSLGRNTGNRAQVALLLGTVIAEGFIAVEAEDSEKVKQIGREVLELAEAINVRKAVIARSKSITEKAEARDWKAVRVEFDGALTDVRGAMEELGDDDLAQLVSMGGWIRGTEVLTSIVQKNYTEDGAELLHQPALLNYFSNRLEGIKNRRLGRDELVVRIRRMLSSIRPLIGKGEGATIPAENVKKIHQLTSETVVAITDSKGA